MVGVVVSIPTTGRGTQTDMDGKFEFKDLPDGTYEMEFNYVTYTKVTRSVTVSGNTPVVVDVTMKSTGNQLKGTTVSTTRRTNTESAVILEIKKASVVVSGISAAQISKTQDRNAADVVKRIPGVTIQDDKFIVIRGLYDRYNTVWLNDAGAPSAEVDKKAFSFDLIPSGLIDRILVFKTPAADLAGDFAGGMVKIYTTAMPDKTQYTLNVQGSYRVGSTGTDFNYLPYQSGDILGYDNGDRNLPSIVPTDPPGRGAFNKNAPNIKAITQSFSNDWNYSTKSQSPDLRISGSAANIIRAGQVKLGNTFGFSYSNIRTNYDKQLYDWDSVTENYHYNDKTSENKVNLAVMENVAATIGNSKLEFRNLFNQVATHTIIERTSLYDSAISSFGNIAGYQLGYENRRTYCTQLSGSHKNNSDTRKYNWTLGYASLVRNMPGLRRLQYGISTDPQNGNEVRTAQLQAQPDISYGGGRLYGKVNEKIYSFSHQFTQKIHVDSDYSFDVNVGNYVEYKDRSYNMRELGYTFIKNAQNYQLLQLPVKQIFENQYLGDQYNFRMEDATNFYDYYKATNQLIASFVSVNLPVGNRVKALIGLRSENNIQKLEAMRNAHDTAKAEWKTDFLLPSINLTYNLTAKSLLRVAYGKTVNRPEFREQAPAYFYDYSLRAGTYGALYFPGSTGLDVATVQNFDARWEYYPEQGELLHIGLFYKSFKNPIQTVLLGGSSEKQFTAINGTKAYVVGLEIDVRKNLIFLDDKLSTHLFRNLVLVGNVSLGKSELTVDPEDAHRQSADVVEKGPLQSQSNYVVNTGLFYQNDSLGLQGSLLYNVFSPRIFAVGRRVDGSIGELAFHSLDLSFSKTVAKRFTVTAGVQNLLDAQVRFYQDINLDNKFDTKNDKPFQTYKPGQYFTLGLKVRL
jgi:outer membrane receptor for ferrienterochelin and colicin